MQSMKSIIGAAIIFLLCLTCSYALMAENKPFSYSPATQSTEERFHIPFNTMQPTENIGLGDVEDGSIATYPVPKPTITFLLIVGFLGLVGFRRTNSTRFNF